MGRRLAKFTSGAVKQLGVAITTILGGAKHKGTPLASIKVIDGPASMIGAEPLKIYAESVKLGRDPTKADFTFYTPDAISTVSGLHCQIERVKGAWRIVALSKKGSETFVDDQAIPFFEPYPLNDGQIVRMGYLAQQPVVFQFNVEAASEESLSEKKITTENLPDNNHVPIDDETRVSKPLTDDEQKETDNIFAEYRDEDKKN
jgi:predicted component of type VI protein secretion system